MSVGTSKIEKQREKEQNSQELWNNYKRYNMPFDGYNRRRGNI